MIDGIKVYRQAQAFSHTQTIMSIYMGYYWNSLWIIYAWIFLNIDCSYVCWFNKMSGSQIFLVCNSKTIDINMSVRKSLIHYFICFIHLSIIWHISLHMGVWKRVFTFWKAYFFHWTLPFEWWKETESFSLVFFPIETWDYSLNERYFGKWFYCI